MASGSLTPKRPNLGPPVGIPKPATPFDHAASGLRADFQPSKTRVPRSTRELSIAPGAGISFEVIPSAGLTYNGTAPILPAPSTFGGLPSDEEDHFEYSSGTLTTPINKTGTGIRGQPLKSKWTVWLESTAIANTDNHASL